MKFKMLIIILLLTTSLLFAYEFPFIEQYFYPKIVVVCFDKETVSNPEGIIDFEVKDGVVKTGIEAFDRLSEKYDFVDLEQSVKALKDLEWNKNGIYPRNIYRIHLKNNKNIESVHKALSNEPYILFAEYETKLRQYFIPDDPLYDQQWHLPQLESQYAWDYTTGDEEVVVGIVDAGIYFTHPDLTDNVWINEAELPGFDIDEILETGNIVGGDNIDNDGNGKVDDVMGWNFKENNNDAYQDYPANDHGTHVAGCTGAIGNNGIGVSGVAMNVKMISSKHAPTTYDYPYVYDGISGMYYCIDSGADIINCSFGGPGQGYQYNTCVDYGVDHGTLTVAAAGNDDMEHSDTYQDYPADCDNALCVAATDENDVKANFSDYGEPIDVSAPGVAIRSTIIEDDGYASYQGTSMASPITAGVAALVKSVHPDLTPLELRQRIMNTCDYIDGLNPDHAGLLGTGRVNAFTATMYDLIPRLSPDSYDLEELVGDGDGVANPGETLNLTIMLQNAFFAGGFWAPAIDVSVDVTCENPAIELENNLNIDYGDIGSAGSVWNDEPIEMTVDADLSELTVTLLVEIESNMDSAYPFQMTEELEVQLSLDQAGWPLDIGGASNSAAALEDINNDGFKEVIFGDQNGYLHAVQPNGEELDNFPIEDLGAAIATAPAVADIDDDGYAEIVIVNDSNKIIAVDYNGDIVFNYDAGGSFKANPMIADVDNNGSKEIIAITFTNAHIYILDADGNDYEGFPLALSGGVLASSALSDLNDDGIVEVLFCSSTGELNAISADTGENISGWPYSVGAASWNGPVVTNLDADEEAEVLMATLTGSITAVNHDGTLLFEESGFGTIKSAPAAADLDDDGQANIAFINSAGQLYVLDNGGNVLDNFPYDAGSNAVSTPILTDMDNDNNIDIIFGDDAGYLHSVSIDGYETANFPSYVGSAIKISPAIADIDNDNDLDIAFPNQTEYLVMDYKNESGAMPWTMFKCNNMRTGNNFQANVESPQNQVPQYTNKLTNNYPNPFNPETTISFEIAEKQQTTIEIYNMKGQKVRTLIDRTLEAGSHNLVWNGKDENGNSVASGLYLYRLKAGKYTSTKKMILMK